MMDLSLLLRHSLIYGLILSLLMGVTFITLTLINPEIWVKDYPPDIKERFGPMSARAQKQRNLAGIPTLVFILGPIILSLIQLARLKGAPLTFADAFLNVFLILLVFNLIDLLILDWLFFVTWQPRLIILPGTEGASGYKDYTFHFRAMLKGTAGSAIASALIAALTLLIQSL